MQLVNEWKRVVNDNIKPMRDISRFKSLLNDRGLEPPQIALGVHLMRGNRSITIGQFINSVESWLVEDPWEAELELATLLAHKTPTDYYIYKDLQQEEPRADTQQEYHEARKRLHNWVEVVLGA